jgi:hypothetical protein
MPPLHRGSRTVCDPIRFAGFSDSFRSLIGILLLILVDQYSRNGLRFLLTSSIEPFSDDGSNARFEECNVIVQMVQIAVEPSCYVQRPVLNEDILEVESEFKVDPVEDLVFLDVSEQFVEVKTVCAGICLGLEDFQIFFQHPFIYGAKKIVHVKEMSIESRTVDARFFADVGDADALDVVSGNDKIQVGPDDGNGALLASFVIDGIHVF